MTFPKHMTSGMTPALPTVKAPMVVAQEPSLPGLPKMPAAPKMAMPKAPKGATVSVKKPKPPTSGIRKMNGM